MMNDMELALNLAWLMTAVILAGLWLRHSSRQNISRFIQISALAVLILILLPIISITDDLYITEFTAETTSGQRKGFLVADLQSSHLILTTEPPMVHTDVAFGNVQSAAITDIQIPNVCLQLLTPFANRPPPSA